MMNGASPMKFNQGTSACKQKNKNYEKNNSFN